MKILELLMTVHYKTTIQQTKKLENMMISVKSVEVKLNCKIITIKECEQKQKIK
jgi:hypothetical protein